MAPHSDRYISQIMCVSLALAAGWSFADEGYWFSAFAAVFSVAFGWDVWFQHRRDLEAARRWREYRLSELKRLREQYTKEVLRQFLGEGREPDARLEDSGPRRFDMLSREAERRAEAEVERRFGPTL